MNPPFGTIRSLTLLPLWDRAVKATVDFAGPGWQTEAQSAKVPVWLWSNPYKPGEHLATQLAFRHNSHELGVSSASPGLQPAPMSR